MNEFECGDDENLYTLMSYVPSLAWQGNQQTERVGLVHGEWRGLTIKKVGAAPVSHFYFMS